MLKFAATVILAYLGVAASRDPMRPLPTITNSLVNLGKMEISFYFNGKGRDSQSLSPDRPQRSSSSSFFPKPEPTTEEPCPCSTLRNVKDSFLSNPAGLLNKILMNNDLFSSHKDPLTSTLCCESHEHAQEGTVIFEFPNPKSMKSFSPRSSSLTLPSGPLPLPNSGMPMPIMPFLFDTIIPNKSMLPPLKTKSIEIFLFPKKKDGSLDLQKFSPKKKDFILKDIMQEPWDKDLKNNNISLFQPVTTPPTVKKDLNLQEKNEKEKTEKEKEKEEKEEKEKEEKEKEQEEKKEKDELEKDDIGDQMMLIEPAGKPNTL